MTYNTQTVTIIIDPISMHCSINPQDYKQLYPHKQNNLTYLVYEDNCFDNGECDFKLELYQKCDNIKNVNTVSNHLTGNMLSMTKKLNIKKIIPYVYPICIIKIPVPPKGTCSKLISSS